MVTPQYPKGAFYRPNARGTGKEGREGGREGREGMRRGPNLDKKCKRRDKEAMIASSSTPALIFLPPSLPPFLRLRNLAFQLHSHRDLLDHRQHHYLRQRCPFSYHQHGEDYFVCGRLYRYVEYYSFPPSLPPSLSCAFCFLPLSLSLSLFVVLRSTNPRVITFLPSLPPSLSGILSIALPISIVGKNFTEQYNLVYGTPFPPLSLILALRPYHSVPIALGKHFPLPASLLTTVPLLLPTRHLTLILSLPPSLPPSLPRHGRWGLRREERREWPLAAGAGGRDKHGRGKEPAVVAGREGGRKGRKEEGQE